MTIEFELDGYRFLGLNGGPFFKMNPSISFHIKCDSIEKVDSYYKRLSNGGKILMELNEYPFSKRYAWIEDKYGVSWQIIHTDKRITQEIVPALMFTQDIAGKAREAIECYTKLFPASKIKQIAEYGKNEFNEKENNVMYSEFILANQELIAMDSGIGHKFKFNEAVSLIIECRDQKEIDYFYEKLSSDPNAEICGWLKDKFGVSWQLVTPEISKLLRKKSAMEALLKMKRLDTEALQQA
jgi:predicted 3-demethylubiquinone-9 3-methyltransferase (glyoxalase superfamily)